MSITFAMIRRLVLATFLIFGITAPANGQIQELKLTASDGEADDGFGIVALSGKRALVGAQGDDDVGDRAGAAYVFERLPDGSWGEIAKLTASDGVADDLFGAEVALDGDIAVIGMPWGRRFESGAACVFERQSSGAWQQVALLLPANPEDSDQFGGSIDVYENRIVIGDSGDDEFRGAAYVFERRQNGDWEQTAKLTPALLSAGDRFGISVSIWEDRVLVGSFNDDHIRGEAFVFERQGSQWVETASFVGHDAANYDGYGWSVSLQEDRAMVGSNGPGPSNSTFIFERSDDGSWNEVAGYRRGFFFGYDVALSGNRAISGAYIDTSPEYTGGAYLFERLQDGSWVQVAHLQASDRESSDLFGTSLAMDGDLVVIGATLDDDLGEDAGAVYVYDLSDFNLIAAGFTLIDAEIGKPVPGYDPVPEGAVLNLKQLPRYLNLRANTTSDVESVQFSYKDNRGRDQQRIENAPPYALYGTDGDGYRGLSFPTGSQTITATPFSRDRARGEKGNPATLNITVVRDDPGLLVSRFVLVDAEKDQDIMQIYDGNIFSLSDLPESINIRAEVLGPAQSVRLTLEPSGHVQVENAVPYALYGDIAGDYFGATLPPGTYTLTAVVFKQPNAKGARGEPFSITFEINEPRSPIAGKNEFGTKPELAAGLPAAYELESAYPNPFNLSTSIRFAMPEQGNVRLAVYDLLGREVKLLAEGVREAGRHVVTFDAGSLPSGTYLYRLDTPKGSFSKAMLLLR